MQNYWETENLSKGVNFWLAAPQETSCDMSIPKEIIPEHINRQHNVQRREKDGSHLFCKMLISSGDLGQP